MTELYECHLADQHVKVVVETVAENYEKDRPHVEALAAGDEKEWLALRATLVATAQQRGAGSKPVGPVLDDIARRLIVRTTGDAVGASDGPIVSPREFFYTSPFDLWARSLLIVRLVHDEEDGEIATVRRAATADDPIAELPDDVAALLRAACDLPNTQRDALLRGIWRPTQDTAILERLEPLKSSLGPKATAPVESGPLSPARTSRSGRRTSREKLEAANRSVARRKLSQRSFVWAFLLDTLLERRSRHAPPSDVEETCDSPAIESELASIAGQKSLAKWPHVAAHVETCACCTSVLETLRQAPLASPDASPMDVEAVMRAGLRLALTSDDPVEVKRALKELPRHRAEIVEVGLVAQATSTDRPNQIRQRALELLVELDAERPIAERIAEAWGDGIPRHQLVESLQQLDAAECPSWLHLARLRASAPIGDRAVISAAGGITGRIERRDDLLTLVLNKLPNALEGHEVQVGFLEAPRVGDASADARSSPDLAAAKLEGQSVKVSLHVAGGDVARLGEGYMFAAPGPLPSANDRIRNAERLFDQGELRRALIEVEEGVALEPREPMTGARFALEALAARIWLRVGRPLEAITHGRNALQVEGGSRHEPGRVTAALARAHAVAAWSGASGPYEHRQQAEGHLQRANEALNQSDDPHDGVLVAWVRAALCDPGALDAVAAERDSVASDHTVAELALEESRMALAAGQLERARAALGDDVVDDPGLGAVILAQRALVEHAFTKPGSGQDRIGRERAREKAQSLAQLALELARRKGRRDAEVTARTVLGLLDGNSERARLETALDVAEHVGDEIAQIDLLLHVADRASHRGDIARTEECLDRVDRLAELADNTLARIRVCMVRARVLRERGRYVAALKELNEARNLRKLREPGVPTVTDEEIELELELTEDFGRVYREQGEMPQAHTHMCDAAGLAALLSNPDKRKHREAKARGAIAKTLLEYKPTDHRGFGDDPEEVARNAIKSLKESGDVRGVGKAWQTIGVALQHRGFHTAAGIQLDKARECLAEVGDLSGEAAVRVDLARVYLHEKGQREALEECDAAIQTAPATDRSLRARAANVRGGVLRHTGQPRKAENEFEQAAAMALELGDRVEHAIALNNLAGVKRDRGLHQEALDLHWRALQIQRDVGDARREGHTLNSLGNIFTDLGKLEDAKELLDLAEERADATHDERGRLKVHCSQGRRLRSLAEFEQAKDIYGKAREKFHAPRDLAKTLNDHAAAICGLDPLLPENVKLLRKALDDCREAAENCAKVNDEAGRGTSIYTGGRLHFALGEHAKALDAFREALRIRESLDDRRRVGLTHWRLAMTLDAMDKRQEAAREYERAEEAHEALRSELATIGLRVAYGRMAVSMYRQHMRLLVRDGRPSEALALWERAHARGLLDRVGGAEIGLPTDAPSATLAAERRLGEPAGDLPPPVLEVARHVGRRTGGPKLRVPRVASPVDTETIQQSLLDERSILLQYILDDEGSTLLAVTPNAIESYPLPGRREIESRVTELRAAVRIGLPRYPHGRWLYRKLIEPAGKLLDDRETLIVVPDGRLALLPFDLLLTDGDEPDTETCELGKAPADPLELEAYDPLVDWLAQGADDLEPSDWETLPYLVRRFSVVNAPSASVAVALRTRTGSRAQPARAHHTDLLEVAPSDGDDATAAALVKATKRAAVRTVHVEADLELDSEKPEFAALRMPGRDGEPYWTHYDIARSAIPTEVLILSASHGAISGWVPGEGLVAMPMAWLAAGARSVVALQWERTPATDELLSAVQSALRDEPTAAAAIRQAKLRMLSRRMDLHPAFWAGLAAWGAPA